MPELALLPQQVLRRHEDYFGRSLGTIPQLVFEAFLVIATLAVAEKRMPLHSGLGPVALVLAVKQRRPALPRQLVALVAVVQQLRPAPFQGLVVQVAVAYPLRPLFEQRWVRDGVLPAPSERQGLEAYRRPIIHREGLPNISCSFYPMGLNQYQHCPGLEIIFLQPHLKQNSALHRQVM
jgi:hypothetical protein